MCSVLIHGVAPWWFGATAPRAVTREWQVKVSGQRLRADQSKRKRVYMRAIARDAVGGPQLCRGERHLVRNSTSIRRKKSEIYLLYFKMDLQSSISNLYPSVLHQVGKARIGTLIF